MRAWHALSVDQWTHLCFTFNGTDARLYVNGHIEDSDVFMELGPGLDTPISLGCYIVNDTTNEIVPLTQGVMDDVRKEMSNE